MEIDMQEVTLHLEQNTDFHIKEAFKTLRSNVEFCGSDVKVVAVTSCTPHEGKTSVAQTASTWEHWGQPCPSAYWLPPPR